MTTNASAPAKMYYEDVQVGDTIPALEKAPVTPALPAPASSRPSTPAPSRKHSVRTGPMNCVQCRQALTEYAEAMDNGENVTLLYPEVQEHLLACESGCLVLLDLFRQEAKASRKYRRRLVRDPFSAIGWELSGFFRGGQVPMSPMALAYGTLILLLVARVTRTHDDPAINIGGLPRDPMENAAAQDAQGAPRRGRLLGISQRDPPARYRTVTYPLLSAGESISSRDPRPMVGAGPRAWTAALGPAHRQEPRRRRQ